MNYLLKSRKGVVLVWVLILYMFFISWFHVSFKRVQDYQEEKRYLEIIDKQLELETKAIKFLKDTYPNQPKKHVIDSVDIMYDCEDKKCTVSFTGDINYAFTYAIIEE